MPSIGFAKPRHVIEAEWKESHPVIQALLDQTNVSKRAWHDLFQTVYEMHSWIEHGAECIRSSLHNNIQKYVVGAVERITHHKDDSELLRVYIAEWSKFYTQTNILPLPFHFIEAERPNVTQNGGLGRMQAPSGQKTIRDVMLESWRTSIFASIADRLRDAALRLVDAERNGEQFDQRLVVGVRESFVVLYEGDEHGEYRKRFEKPFIDETYKYYEGRAEKFLKERGIQEYMTFADAKLADEVNRARKYLQPETDSINKLIDRCTDALVVRFMEELLAECFHLVLSNDIQRLRQLYHLIKRAPSGMGTVITCIDQHIRREGLADMRANADSITSDPERYVTQLLSLFERFSTLVHDAFEDDPRLLTTRDKAFQQVVNDTSIFRMELNTVSQRKSGRLSVESKCPELLANYCDLLLRKTPVSKKLTGDQIDAKLNSVLLVLKYVDNKDVFMRFHKAHLSRRLILDLSADQDKEEYMVNRLRDCGMPAEHVTKLSKMLTDVEVSKSLANDMRADFQQSRPDIADLVTVKVLSTGAWGRPGGASSEGRVHVSLPRELDELIPPVEAFYDRKYSGRKLNWQHHWSTATMTFTPRSGGCFDLDVTTFQLVVLLCWNERPAASLSYESLRTATELPNTELSRTLFSLTSIPKQRSQILLTDAPSPIRSFNDSTTFRLNHDFQLVKNSRVQERGRLNLIGRLQLTLEQTAKTEHDDIVALRQFRVQEAIMKILKTRRECTLAQLQSELVEMLKSMFIPSRNLIKEQIDWMLESNFISRKPDNMEVFQYVS